jgi:formate dehydrogenase subunit delta
MNDRDLVRMANQIADFFRPYPAEEAKRETANHIRNFWEPRMRRQIYGYVAKGGEGLRPLAREALLALAADDPIRSRAT